MKVGGELYFAFPSGRSSILETLRAVEAALAAA
jgi:hypothetical protein